MRTRRIYRTVVAIALAIPCLGLGAGPTETLAARADAVVVAEVRSGGQPGNSASFTLSVERALKGPLLGGDTAVVSRSRGLGWNRDLTGSYGLWFLNKAGDGKWSVLGPANAQIAIATIYFPLAKGATNPAVASSATPFTIGDEIAVEIAGSLPHHADNTQLFSLATGLLEIAESPTLLAVLRSLRLNPDPELKFVGLAGLVGKEARSPLTGVNKIPNPMRVIEAKSALAEIASNLAILDSQPVSPSLVASAVGMVRDAGSTEALAKIASSSHQLLRRDAAHALSCIHTRETLPILAELLDSSDARLRQEAIFGMAAFVKNLPIATNDNIPNGRAMVPKGSSPYRTAETDKYSFSGLDVVQANEAEFVQFWKSWWARMKTQLSPGSQ